MDEFTRETIKLILDKGFNQKSSFYICMVNDLGDLLQVNPRSHPNYPVLHALHCVSYSDMSSEMKDALPNKVMECLSSRFNVEGMARAMAVLEANEIHEEVSIEDAYLDVSPSSSTKKLGWLKGWSN